MNGLALAAARLAAVTSITLSRLSQFLLFRWLFSKEEQKAFALSLVHRWGKSMVKTVGLDVQVVGIPPSVPCLWVGNHRSYLDIAALASISPVLFLAKDEIASWPVFGAAARAGGMVFVKRGDRADRKKALVAIGERIQSRASLVVFPEGTTFGGPGIREFRQGAFTLSHDAGVRVATFAIEYADPKLAWVDDDTFVGHFFRTQTKPRHVVRVEFGRSLDPRRFADAVALRHAAEIEVQSLLENESRLCRVA